MDYIDTVLIGQAAARAGGGAGGKEYALTLATLLGDLRSQLDAKDAEMKAVKVALLRKSVSDVARKTTMQAMMAEINACPEVENHHPLARIEKRSDGEERSGASQLYYDSYDAEAAKAK